MVCMRALTFVFAVGIGGLAAGCGGPRSILVPKDVSAFNNVSEGGNVFVHVANHGLQNWPSIQWRRFASQSLRWLTETW